MKLNIKFTLKIIQTYYSFELGDKNNIFKFILKNNSFINFNIIHHYDYYL